VHVIVERTLGSVCCEYLDRRVNIPPGHCRWEARPLDSESCRWVTLSELRELAMPPVNTETIRQLA
jgi:hypothetical protein